MPDLCLWQDHRAASVMPARPQIGASPTRAATSTPSASPRKSEEAPVAPGDRSSPHRPSAALVVDEFPKELRVSAAIRQEAELVARRRMPADMKNREASSDTVTVFLSRPLSGSGGVILPPDVRQVPCWRDDST